MLKKIILTGANGQLGKSYIKLLLENDYQIVAVDKSTNQLAEFSKDIEVAELDITDPTAVNQLFEEHSDVYGLVNNAGIAVFTPFEDRTAEEFMDVVKVNLLGTFLMCQGAIKQMKLRSEGKIVNVGSIYGVVSSDPGIYGNSRRNNSEVYSISKAGIIQLTKYMAAHFGRVNIQTNSISPGGVYNRQSDDFVRNYESKTPMNRMANPEDLHSTLLFLLSASSNYVNGQNIIVDGGFTSW